MYSGRFEHNTDK